MKCNAIIKCENNGRKHDINTKKDYLCYCDIGYEISKDMVIKYPNNQSYKIELEEIIETRIKNGLYI